MQHRNVFPFLRCVRNAAAAVLSIGCLALPPTLKADEKALTHSQIAEANKPGTIMIQTQWTAQVRVPREEINTPALLKYAANQAKLRMIPNNTNAMVKAIFDELLRHSNMYLVPGGTTLGIDVDTVVRGSGFIITPDGYIVTNAHVVYMPPDELKDTIVDYWNSNQLQELFKADFKRFVDTFQSTVINEQDIQDKLGDFVNAEIQYYKANMAVSAVQTHVFALMGVAIPGLPTQPKGIPCDIRKVGQPTPGKDVAILKIEQNNLPTVPVGDDGTMKSGDPIIVLGYPGAADLTKEQTGVESSLTQGDLSARKTMPGGWQALQTSAEINHGNSGGPAFNDHGEVIGIATFGPVEQGVRGINFLVPISVAKEFMNELNIKPQQSRLSQLYNEGIASMNKSCYKGALDKFKEVSDLSPGFPFVQDKITQSRNAIDQGMDRCWMPSPTYIVAAVATLLIILTAVWLLMRRRSVAVPAGGPPPMPGPAVELQRGPAELGPPAAARPQAAQSYGSVQCTTGSCAGKRYEITKQGLLIGRDASKCQVVLNDDGVSKEHAWIVPLDADGTVVIDRGSTNGTFVNSTSSPKISKVRLQHGDRIYIGKGTAVFTYYSS